MKKEMLSIVATLDEFWSMLLGSDIHVFTNHKNETFDNLKMQQVLCLHNKVEEFSPTLHYIEGHHNVLADNLSRPYCMVTPTQITEGKILIEPTVVSDDEDDMYFLTQEYSGFHYDELVELIEYYLNHPEIPHDRNQLNYAYIWEWQQQDKKLLALHNKYPDTYIKLK